MKEFRFFSLCSSKHIFISHMVQMKDPKLAVKARALNAFISHMVQMKERFSHSNRQSRSFFISHMVQMKG